MTRLCVKFRPSSTPPSDRFWWGVVLVLVLVLLVLLVTGVKQSQLLVLRLSLEFDKKRNSRVRGPLSRNKHLHGFFENDSIPWFSKTCKDVPLYLNLMEAVRKHMLFSFLSY